MEAGVPILQWVNERFQNVETRVRSNHDTISELRKSKEAQGKALVRIEEKLEDQANDLAEIKKTMTWIMRGLFGAIAVGLMFVVAIATLIIQASG